MLSAVRRVYYHLPQSRYFYLFLLSSPLLLVLVPVGILLSHPLRAAVLDLIISLFLVLLVGLLSSQTAYVSVALAFAVMPLAALIRMTVIAYVQGLTEAQTAAQRRGVAVIALLTALASLLSGIYLHYPIYLLVVCSLSALLVTLSSVWVPTSFEQSWEAETQILRETLLLDEVQRGKKAGTAFILLDDNKQRPTGAETASSSVVQNGAAGLSTYGAGTARHALVLLHGYGAGAGYWVPHLNKWRSLGKLYSLDILGFGQSSHDSFTANTPEQAEHHYVSALNRWREAEGLDSFILIGHSFGGYLAAAYALKYPQHIKYLILVSPVGIPNPPASNDIYRGPPAAKSFRHVFQFLWNQGLSPASALHFLGPLGKAAVNKVIHLRFSHLPLIQQTPGLATYLYHINAGKGTGLSTLNALIQPGAYARLPLGNRMKEHLSIPTHFIYGESDWMDSAESRKVVQEMKKRGIAAYTTIITHCGHQLVWENPTEFSECIIKIVKEIENTSK